MIPVRLEIEGLYSYRERQTVEFETLTAAGLFGIFGAVGSGKSSILEAILLALYGSTERLSATGERSSMVNLQSDQLLINFTFCAGKSNSKTYLARYSAKRNKKDPEKIDTGVHVFYQLKEGNWEGMPEKADSILGMSKEHFKQTIIIPQGKFREFIDQKPLERAEMMQQLFGLEKFDLSSKTGSLLKATREDKIRLETLLKGLEEVSQETLQSKQRESDLLEADAQKAIQSSNNTALQFRKLDLIRKAFIQLQELKIQSQRLESRSKEMEEKRQLYREFITAKTYLRPVWDRMQDGKKDLEKYHVSVTDCERFKETFEREIEGLEKQEVKLKETNEKRPIREGKIRDLRKVLEIQELSSKRDSLQHHLETLKPEWLAQKEALKILEEQISELDTKSENLPSTDPNLLAELKTIQSQLKIARERINELNRIKAQFVQEEDKVKNLLNEIKNRTPNNQNSLESWAESQRNLLKILDNEREKLLRKLGLGAHVHLLSGGEPCPLCGGVEHPKPLEISIEESAIKQKDLLITQEKDHFEKILSLIQKEKDELKNLDFLQRNLQDKVRDIQSLDSQCAALWKKLKDAQIPDESTLTSSLAQLSQNHSAKETLLQQIQALRKKWTLGRDTVEKTEKQVQQIQMGLQDVLSRVSSKEQEIKDPTFCKPYFQKEADVIRKEISDVELSIDTAAKDLLGKQKHLQEKRIAQSRNLADLENYRSLVSQFELKVQESGSELENLKKEYGFPDEAELIRLFHHSIDAEKTDLEIRYFDQERSTTRSRIEALQSEEGIGEFTDETYERVQQDLQEAQQLEKTLQAQLAVLRESLKETAHKLEEKQQLRKVFEQVETRESYLRELDRLFQGKGFVKYVSSIYLRELCNTANLRFMKLTKNSLSLEIDEDNTFWVIDYLNGGKKRLLKTLSGGQTFQASLCLALALAEKVKALNQADQSFFFLDEGFGALDRNSLRVVFETLKALRHENRVVGIISHVEELQQEVGVYAQIELDAERGSQIRYSY